MGADHFLEFTGRNGVGREEIKERGRLLPSWARLASVPAGCRLLLWRNWVTRAGKTFPYGQEFSTPYT